PPWGRPRAATPRSATAIRLTRPAKGKPLFLLARASPGEIGNRKSPALRGALSGRGIERRLVPEPAVTETEFPAAEASSEETAALEAGEVRVGELRLQGGCLVCGQRSVRDCCVDLRRRERLPCGPEAGVQRCGRDAQVRGDRLRLAERVGDAEVVLRLRLQVVGPARAQIAVVDGGRDARCGGVLDRADELRRVTPSSFAACVTSELTLAPPRPRPPPGPPCAAAVAAPIERTVASAAAATKNRFLMLLLRLGTSDRTVRR